MSLLARDANGATIQAVKQGAVQNVSYTSSAQKLTSPVKSETTIIQVCATSTCYYLVGVDPTATTATGTLLPANVIVFIPIGGSLGRQISFIQASANGAANITEGAV